MKKAYLVLVLGIFNLCASLGLFIESFVSEFDGYGLDISSSQVYLFWLISSIIITILGYVMYKENKVK